MSSFGAPAPATSTGFGGAPAPATSTGFGGAPAPASGAFGGAASSATTPTSFVFGSSSAPAPSPGTFGTTPFSAPSPSTFGAPAPFASGGFGSPAPAPLFAGSAPAPGVPPFGSMTPGAQSVTGISGKTPYSQLPQHFRAAIDHIHENMMKHKRTIIQIQASGPFALQKDDISASTDPDKASLPMRLERIKKTLQELHQDVGTSLGHALEQKERIEELTKEAYIFAKWPTEAVAARRGVVLSQPQQRVVAGEEKKQETDANTQDRLREVLAAASSSVDRLERMPSPYLWLLLKDFERRLVQANEDLAILRLQLQQNQCMLQSDNGLSIASLVEEQHRKLTIVGDGISRLSFTMQQIRQSYNNYEKEENVLDQQKWAEMERERKINDQIQRKFLVELPSASSTSNAPTGSGTATSAPGTGGGLFGASTSSSTAFGGTSSFGSTSAPAPFGAPVLGAAGTPAPAPFGTTGPAFASSTTAPGPAAFGGFASSSSSNAPKKKKDTRSSGRLHAAGH